MKLSELKNQLQSLESLNFIQPNGYFIPRHFHITEVGVITKKFIDCGGAIHSEKVANIQIWVASDLDHRLSPKALLNILDISEKILNGEDLEIEVEFQTETIGKYGLDMKNENFVLTVTKTDCLAKELCGIPVTKQKIQLVELGKEIEGFCTPGGTCC